MGASDGLMPNFSVGADGVRPAQLGGTPFLSCRLKRPLLRAAVCNVQVSTAHGKKHICVSVDYVPDAPGVDAIHPYGINLIFKPWSDVILIILMLYI